MFLAVKKLQFLSRADTAHLRSGLCPNCNGHRFIIHTGLYHHQQGCFRRILCIACLREFGVAPAGDDAKSIIINYLMPDHRLESDYQIHTGTLGAPQALECATPVALSDRPQPVSL